ncbi:hypothetical protein AURDEDRAFT_158549 [Auricularia subglabra TFB-10046 SS5]|nr:hypothetical protein AURDEDRAFT_158549 [Auricularia subglabra TFB-10046 SS5]
MGIAFPNGDNTRFVGTPPRTFLTTMPGVVTDYTAQLYNALQSRGTPNALQWREYTEGPRHAPLWTVVAYYNGVEYGKGTAASKTVARSQAARATLQNLGYRV